jgi:hypothetical protein
MDADPAGQTGKDARRPRIPGEIATMLAFALAIFGVVATGSAISSAITQPSPWLFAAAYGGPAALAFGVYWAVSRKL